MQIFKRISKSFKISCFQEIAANQFQSWQLRLMNYAESPSFLKSLSKFITVCIFLYQVFNFLISNFTRSLSPGHQCHEYLQNIQIAILLPLYRLLLRQPAAYYLQSLQTGHPANRAILQQHVSSHSIWLITSLILPMTRYHFPVQSHTCHDKSKLTVAMCTLIQVHKIHIDFTPGNITVKLCMKMQQWFFKIFNPPIHIFAGEKVCIQAMMPMQFFAIFASWQIW